VTIDDSLQFLRGFPELLASRGWDVHLVSTNGPRLAAYAESSRVVTHAVRMERDPRPIRDAAALMRWVALIRRVKPDVAYVGTPKAGLLGIIAGWVTRVPARIYVLRGLRLETATGRQRQLLIGLEKLTMRLATSVICVSDSLREVAVDMRLAPPRKLIVLGAGSSNGVDVDLFRPNRLPAAERVHALVELGLNPTQPVIGFVGRLTRDKGLDELADALVVLGANGVEAQLLIVGGVDDPSGELATRRLAATGARVVATGYRNDPENVYQLMTVLCLPSHREGFANVSLEAAASGVPIVGSNATGVRDGIVDGRTGFTVPLGAPERLAAAIEALLRDDALAEQFGAAARERVIAMFDRGKVQELYADAMTSALPPDRRRAALTVSDPLP